MNYRHHFHAGNFADVAKHFLLVQLMRAMQRKPKPFVFLDTHAGRGAYDLAEAATGDSLARTPEWPEGIGRLWGRTDLPEAVRGYVEQVREFDRRSGNLTAAPRFYPGSPWLAVALAREMDRIVVCEKHPAEFAALRDQLAPGRLGAGTRRVSFHETDGYAAIGAMLPPPERRALVLIDPPYEAEDEFVQAAAAVAEGLRRLPAGVFALWYPLTERARVQEFFAAIVALEPPPTVVFELAVAGDFAPQKMKGCGVIVINPPWQFDREARGGLEYLAGVLGQERGAAARITWLVPEK